MTTGPIDRSRTAMLLMDLQPGVLSGIPERDALVRRVVTLCSDARRMAIQLIHIRTAFAPQDYASVSDRNETFTSLASSGALADGTPEAALDPAFLVEPGEIRLIKTRIGAFSSSNLALHLRGRDIHTVVLAGVSTRGVVLSTACEASDRDLRVIVVDDCCADPEPAVHRLLMDHVLPVRSTVLDTHTLRTLLEA